MAGRAAIGFWTQAEGQAGFDIHVVSDIVDDDFDRYMEAIATYRSITERYVYQLLDRDWQRLRSMRAIYTNVERVGGSFRAVDKRTLSGLFMGEVTHWLSTTRLYLESQRDSLVRLFGDGSDQTKRFVAATNRVFDANEGYRFLYNLRDYSQHCGPPLGGLTVSSLGNGTRSVELYLSRSELLLARFGWSRHAKALLEQWDEKILLMPLIDQAMIGFREIEHEVMAMLIEHCGSALPTLREGINRATEEGGNPAIFRLSEAGDESKVAWQSFPSSNDLDRLGSALRESDPIAVLLTPQVDSLGERPREVRHAENQAAAVIGVWLEYGPGDHLTETVNRVVQEDVGITPLVTGLVNLSAYLLSMLSISLGTSAKALVGGFVANERPDLGAEN
jgi:hypothetical protein